MRRGKILKISAATVLLMTLVVGNLGVEAKEEVITTSKIKEGAFKIGVIGTEGDSVVGKAVEHSVEKQSMKGLSDEEESLQLLDEDIEEIPDDIDALWVSEENMKASKVKRLYKQAKKEKKPFYVFGEKLDAEEITSTFEPNLEISAEYDKDTLYSLDMFGYKFEDNQVKVSSVISINRGDRTYDLEDLQNLTKRYDINIKRNKKSKLSFFRPNVASAAGIEVNLPDSFSNIYTWETEVNNWIDINATHSELAKTYHVWEVYKDDTPSNPDTKSYVYFRADEPLNDLIEVFTSKEFVHKLDNDTTSNIITKSWAPDDSAYSGSVDFNLSWPPGASFSWDTSGDIEIFNSDGNLQTDWHEFSVEDNEYFDDVLRPSDVWVSSQAYTITQNAAGHKIGHDFEATIDGHTGKASPDEVDDYDTKSKYYFYWVVRR